MFHIIFQANSNSTPGSWCFSWRATVWYRFKKISIPYGRRVMYVYIFIYITLDTCMLRLFGYIKAKKKKKKSGESVSIGATEREREPRQNHPPIRRLYFITGGKLHGTEKSLYIVALTFKALSSHAITILKLNTISLFSDACVTLDGRQKFLTIAVE